MKILIEEFPNLIDSTLIMKKLNENIEMKKSKKLQLKLQNKPTYELRKSYSVILSPRKSNESPTKLNSSLKTPITPQTPNTPLTPLTPRDSTYDSELSTNSLTSGSSPRLIDFVVTEFKQNTIKFKEIWNENSFILKMNEIEVKIKRNICISNIRNSLQNLYLK